MAGSWLVLGFSAKDFRIKEPKPSSSPSPGRFLCVLLCDVGTTILVSQAGRDYRD